MLIISFLRRFLRRIGTSGLILVLIYLVFTTSGMPQRVRNGVESAISHFHLWSESSDLQNAKKKLAESGDALRELKQNREGLQTQLVALQSRRTQLAERLASQRRQLGESLLSDGSTEPSANMVDLLDKYRRLAASMGKLEAAFDEGSRSIEALDAQIAAAENAGDDAAIRLAAREVVFAAHDALARGDALLQTDLEP